MVQEQQDGQQQKIRWQPTRKQLLWAGGITSLAFLLIGICVYLFGWKWTGLPKKTLWDYLELLIVPAALALGVYWLNRRQEERGREADAERERYRQAQEALREHEREADAAQREREREAAEEARRQRDLEVENQRAQDEALRAYLDQMSQLLTDREQPLHRALRGDSLSTVARARTLTVLGRLNSARKRSVMQFLYESGLIYKSHTVLNKSDLIERRRNIVNLRQADLNNANLIGAFLIGADLRWANLREVDLSNANLIEADLISADLVEANLSNAKLREANLRGANLIEADLINADLVEADLSNADLSNANLRGANLRGADLRWANLREVDLRGTSLREADLRGARGWTGEQLSEAWTTEGATMPDGQTLKSDTNPDGPTLEEWLKSKGRGEDEENSGPS